MKILIMTAILFFAALASCRGALSGDVSVRLLVNNREKKLVPPAVIRNGKAYVGLRGITKVLGGCTSGTRSPKQPSLPSATNGLALLSLMGSLSTASCSCRSGKPARLWAAPLNGTARRGQ